MRLSRIAVGTGRCAALIILLAIILTPGRTEACDGQSVFVGGHRIEGESFVFCLDRSVSMGWGGLYSEQVDVFSAALRSLQPTQTFSIVTFGDSTSKFSFSLVAATPTNVNAAIAFMANQQPEGFSEMGSGLLESLLLLGDTPNSAIIATADGYPYPAGTAATLAFAAQFNTQNVPIHGVLLPSIVNIAAVEFLGVLTSAFGGTYVDLSAPSPLPSFIRGDANGDGTVNLADAIEILQIGFGLSTSPTCLAAHDVNADDAVEAIADAVTLLGTLFLTTFPPIAEPHPSCGLEPVDPICPETCEAQFCP